MNIKSLIENWILKQEKPFISERHLQNELWYYLKDIPEVINAVVEMPFKQKGKKGHSFLDIYVQLKDQKIGIEIKYQTKVETINWFGVDVTLKDKGADDLMRINSVLDVQRLELLKSGIIKELKIDKGIFILLSNTPTVWKGTNRKTIDKNFRFYDSMGNINIFKNRIDIEWRDWTKHAQKVSLTKAYQFEKKDFNNMYYSILEI